MPHYIVNSELLYTRLITPVNYLPIKKFRQGIQSLYEDMIISLFAEPSFSVVSWAANGKPSGIAKGGPSTAYPCRRQRIATFFHYNMAQLLSVYAASIFFGGYWRVIRAAGFSRGGRYARYEAILDNRSIAGIESSRPGGTARRGCQDWIWTCT